MYNNLFLFINEHSSSVIELEVLSSIASFETKTVTRTSKTGRGKARKTQRTNLGKQFPFSPRAVVELNYMYLRDSSASVADNAIIRLNSAFDFDYSGTGHQPMGFDQYAGLYSTYRVLQVKFQGHLLNTNTDPCVHTWNVSTDPTVITASAAGISNAAEQPNGGMAPVYGEGAASTSFSKSYRIAQVLGLTEAQYRSDDSYAAVTNTNPAIIAYLHNAISDGSGTAQGGVFFMLKCILTIEFTLPIVMASS